MKVIEKKELIEKEIRCKTCESLLAYNAKDIYEKTIIYLGEYFDSRYIKCPVCGANIFID